VAQRPIELPPEHLYPPDDWRVVETGYSEPYAHRGESAFALSNGYLGIRGTFDEGRPAHTPGTYVNGFHETWPIVHTEDAYGLGSAYWVWKQACGDPQNGIGPIGDGLMRQDCETGEDAAPRADLLEILSRAYPQSAPGELTALTADGAEFALAGTADGEGCGLRVWVPGSAKPDLRAEGITEVELTEVPGGWTVTGCVDGEYSLTAG